MESYSNGLEVVALFSVYVCFLVFAEYCLTLLYQLSGISHHPCFCNSPIWLSICISSKHIWNVLISQQALICPTRLTGTYPALSSFYLTGEPHL